MRSIYDLFACLDRVEARVVFRNLALCLACVLGRSSYWLECVDRSLTSHAGRKGRAARQSQCETWQQRFQRE